MLLRKLILIKKSMLSAHKDLQSVKKMLTLAKAGKYNGYLLEGMACPGGCVAVPEF